MRKMDKAAQQTKKGGLSISGMVRDRLADLQNVDHSADQSREQPQAKYEFNFDNDVLNKNIGTVAGGTPHNKNNKTHHCDN